MLCKLITSAVADQLYSKVIIVLNKIRIFFCLIKQDNCNNLADHSYTQFLGLAIHQGDTSIQLPVHILYMMPRRKMPQMRQYHFLPFTKGQGLLVSRF